MSESEELVDSLVLQIKNPGLREADASPRPWDGQSGGRTGPGAEFCIEPLPPWHPDCIPLCYTLRTSSRGHFVSWDNGSTVGFVNRQIIF